MLLKLTCPSCGRSDQASDRVIGKEVRCPCGATFRVLGPKQGPLSAFDSPQPRSQSPAPPYFAPPLARNQTTTCVSRSISRLPPCPIATRAAASRAAARTGAGAVRSTAQAAPGGLPPWAYAAFGGAAVLFVVVLGALIVSLSSSTPPSSRNSTRPDDRVTTHPEPKPADAATRNTERTAAPETTVAQPLTGSTETSSPTNVSPRSPATPLTTAQIVARREPSVALVKGKVSSGTGFLIRYGVIATNAHVIEQEFISNLEVRFPSAPAGNQGPIKAQLLYEDRKRDIAFLAVKSDLPVLPIAPNYSFVKGEDILVIGNPGMGDDTVLENAISRGVMTPRP